MLLYKEFSDMSIGFVGEFPWLWDLFRQVAEEDENQALYRIRDSTTLLVLSYQKSSNATVNIEISNPLPQILTPLIWCTNVVNFTKES